MTYNDSSESSKFDGRWIAGKYCDGTLKYKNGDSFSGLFSTDGRRYKGTLTYANGGESLETKQTRREHLAELISKS